jgi:hypothetical protein
MFGWMTVLKQLFTDGRMQKTKELKRGRVYDCRGWDDLAVVEVTMRGVIIRYTEASISSPSPMHPSNLKCTQAETPPTT